MKTLVLALFAGACMTTATNAAATIFHYELSDAVFMYGGTASGTFDYDTQHGVINVDITTTPYGSGFDNSPPYAGFHWTGSGEDQDFSFRLHQFDGTLNYIFDIEYGNYLSAGASTYLEPESTEAVYYSNSVTTRSLVPGGQILFLGSDETTAPPGYDPTRGGEVPEPGMLGLFALCALGLGLTRRRASV